MSSTRGTVVGVTFTEEALPTCLVYEWHRVALLFPVHCGARFGTEGSRAAEELDFERA
jgi:hypothetical protein